MGKGEGIFRVGKAHWLKDASFVLEDLLGVSGACSKEAEPVISPRLCDILEVEFMRVSRCPVKVTKGEGPLTNQVNHFALSSELSVNV